MLLELRPKPPKSPHPLEPTNPRCNLCEAIRRLWSCSLNVGCLDTLRLRLGGSAMSSRLRQIAPSTCNHRTPAAQTAHTQLFDRLPYHRELYRKCRDGNVRNETASQPPCHRHQTASRRNHALLFASLRKRLRRMRKRQERFTPSTTS